MTLTRRPPSASEPDDVDLDSFSEYDARDEYESDARDEYDEAGEYEDYPEYVETAPAPRRRRTSSEPPRERTMPAGRVLILMLVGLIVSAFMNADAIERSSNAAHADSWRADVAHVLSTIAGPLTLPRERIDRALGNEVSGESIEELQAEQQRATASEGDEAPEATTTTLPEVRTPTAAEPMRLYVGGDSMASEFSKSMERVAATTGVMTSTLDPRVSTGLSRPDYFNWPAHLVNDVLPQHPEALIMMFGANDAQNITLDNGEVLERFSEPWLDEYRTRVAGTMDLLKGENRMTFWVGMPIMDPDAGVRGQDELNHIYWSEAKKRPWIRYVDSWPFYADENGNYQHRLPSKDGTVNGLRQADGVHWSKWGADRIAWEVLQAIEKEVDLSNGTVLNPPEEIAPDEIKARKEVPNPQ
jgi:hypothetical protein